MIIERTIHGGYRCSDIIHGYRVTRLYLGYTKREAMRLFRAECWKGESK